MADQPLWNSADKDSGCTLSNSDRTASQAALNAGMVRSTASLSSGKWYVEATFDSGSSYYGIATSVPSTANQPGFTSAGWACLKFNGSKYTNNSATAYGSGFTDGDIVTMAVDLDNDKIWWGKNGTWFNSGDPAAGTNEAFSSLTGTYFLAFGSPSSSGAKNLTLKTIASYSYSPPSGFYSGWGGTTVTTYNQAVTATSTVTASILKTVNKFASASATCTGSITKAVAKFCSATSTVTGSIVKTVSKALVATSTAAATLAKIALRPVVMAATSTVAAVMQRTTAKYLAATSAADAAIQKIVAKSLAATTEATATLARAFAVTLQATSAVSASITRTISTTLSAASTVTADMLRAAVFGVSMAVTSTVTGVLETIRTAFVTMEAASTVTATISRVVSITMSVAVPAVTRPIQWVAHMFAATRNDKANWNQCARCLTKTRPNKLLRQMEFVGQRERWTGLYVCNLCIDDPQPQNITPRTLGGDPRPVPNARPRKD